MAGFYGNINNINKSTFQFDKIYTSREAMESGCSSDGVFIGRYVLVKYPEINNNDNTSNDNIDKKAGYRPQGYDGTVWQKVYGSTANSVEYILVADLNSTPPTISVEAVAPGTDFASINERTQNAMHYSIMIPSSWQFAPGDFNYNEKKFNKEIHYYKSDNEEDKITLTPIATGEKFPKVSNEGFENDTYELNINLPSIGDVISEIWDIIYGITDEDVKDDNDQSIGKQRKTDNIFEDSTSLAGAYNALKNKSNELTTNWQNYQNNLNTNWSNYQNNLNTNWSNYQKYLTGNIEIPESFDENWIGEFPTLQNEWVKYQKYLTGNTEIPKNFDENWIGEFGNLKDAWRELKGQLEILKTDLEILRGSVIEDPSLIPSDIEDWNINTVYKIIINGTPRYYYKNDGGQQIELNPTIWGTLMDLSSDLSTFKNEIREMITTESFDALIQQDWDNWDDLENTKTNLLSKGYLKEAFDQKADIKDPIFTGTPKVHYDSIIEYGQSAQDVPIITEKTFSVKASNTEPAYPQIDATIGNSDLYARADHAHESEIFIGTMGGNGVAGTTIQELADALNKHKAIFVLKRTETNNEESGSSIIENNIYQFSRVVDNNYYFYRTDGTILYWAKLDNENNWTVGEYPDRRVVIVDCISPKVDGRSDSEKEEDRVKINQILRDAMLNKKEIVCRYNGNYTGTQDFTGNAFNYFQLTFGNAESNSYDFRCWTYSPGTGRAYFYDIQYVDGTWKVDFADPEDSENKRLNAHELTVDAMKVIDGPSIAEPLENNPYGIDSDQIEISQLYSNIIISHWNPGQKTAMVRLNIRFKALTNINKSTVILRYLPKCKYKNWYYGSLYDLTQSATNYCCISGQGATGAGVFVGMPLVANNNYVIDACYQAIINSPEEMQ